MITSEDVRRVTFDKAIRGYRCEDVNDYLKQVADSMDAMAAENADLQKKLVVLAQRIDQYRADEDTLRTTMINAQRLGENVIREAKQKAAEIIRDANIKAEDREQTSRDEVELAKQEIVTLKSEADSFKRGLMEMYRKHINLISKLPEYTPEPAKPVSEAQPVQPAPAQPVQPMQAAQPVQAVRPEAQPAPAQPDPAPEYYEESPAPQPVPEQKVDTVEFAIAPREDDDEPAPQPVQEPVQQTLEDAQFAPGAGLYDDDLTAPSRKSRKPAAKRGARKPKAEAKEPSAFDSFENVDYDV